MTDRNRKVLLVGHCRPDSYAMRAALGRFAPGAEFVDVTDERELAEHADADALLVNRVLDGDFQSGSGLALIEKLPAERRGRAVLISNLADAQRQAEALGATPGFGKSELYSEQARAAMEALLGAEPRQ